MINSEKPVLLCAYKVKVERPGKACCKCGKQFKKGEVYNKELNGGLWHSDCVRKGLVYVK